MFWPVIEHKILPIVSVVINETIIGLSPKDKVTKVKLLAKMNSINDRVLEKLFVPPVDPEDEDNETSGTYLIDSDEE